MKIFGLTFGRKAVPTPLQEATNQYTRNEFELLAAHADLEDAVHTVELCTARRERLRAAMRELADDKSMPDKIRPEDHPRFAGAGAVSDAAG